MKKITLLLFALFTCWQINAQVSSYSFTESTETYAQITGTTSTATGDDGTQTNIPIGFTFNFGGVNYTAFGISTNGIIRLGSNATDTAIASGWTNALSNTAGNRPLIAPFWDDNNMTGGEIRYSLTGTAPNQVLTVNWHNSKIGGGGSTAGATLSYLIRLHETTNVVEIVYGSPFTTTNTVTASVGLNGSTSFLSVTPAATSTVSSATANNAINATVMANLAGKLLTFTPPSCSAPSGFVASNLTTTSATISWNAATPVPSTGYEYYYSNVNTAPAGAGTPTASLTDNLSGLTPNTTYYVWLRSDCGGGNFSAWVGPFTFFTGYCIPSSTSSSSFVDNFSTTGGSLNISNLTSGFTTGGYLDATSQVVESYENGSFDFNATIQGATVGFAIWIDWNNNLVFEASEKVYNTTAYGSGPFSGTITVPGGTALGNYRMRITTDWNASNPSNPCAAAARAEFEDYTVTVSNPPSCLVPNTIIASNITSSTVDLSWTDGSGGLQFDYEYVIQAPGTGEPTGAGAQIGDVTVVGEGFDINGNPLTPNTLYEVYVRSDCGGSFSSWAGPITFRTLCEAFTVPFSEGFNSTSTTEACWTKLNVNADGDAWDTNYTINPFEGDQVAVMYTDFNAGANDDWLISPTITLTGNQRLKFHYRVQSAGEPNDFELLLSTTGTAPASFTNTLIANTSYSNITYIEQVVDLSAYSGDVNIAWHVPNGGLDGWRLYIDNVIVEDIPSCVEPNTIIASNVTSSTVDLSWTDGSGGAQFDYEYAIQAPGTGIPATAGAQVGDVTVVGEGFDINGNPLAANTTYEVYVRADCGGGDFSPWIGPITFTTLCNTYVAPYTEDFENAGTIPSCWNMSGSENWRFSNTGAGNHIGNNGVITGTTTSGGYFAWIDDSSPNTTNATLTSPLIDVSGLTVPRLTFFELSNNEGANPNSTLNVEVWDGAAWNAMATYNTNTNGWEKRVIDLSTLTITGDIQVRFIIVESSSFYDDIAIDDVTIEETPSCLEPTMFTVDTVGTDTVTVSWTAGAGETEWEYVVQAQGTGVPAGTGVSTTSNPLVISGLTPNTPYEIYLRAVCSVTEQSIWVGPYNVETNIEVVCGTPVNTTYCYTDNDSTSWTFTSSDGSPLRVVFNAGQVENTWDELIVIDSDGVTQLYNGYGAAGNLAGLTFDATGDTITVMISSDGSANCGDSAYTSWDFDVVCATCVNPTVSFNVVPDCANSQYSIEVDVTNIGSATSLTISDGTTDLTGISATGVQTFGPYADGSSNTVVVTNEQDGACFVTSGALSYSCPPSNDDCVNAIAVDCGDVVTGTTTTATNSSGGTSADVWYSYSGAAGDITVSLCNNTNYDSYLRVYDACGGTEIAFNDDFCNAQSSVTFTADGTTTYYILVEGFGSNVGNFEMAVTCVLSNGDFNSNSFSAYPNPVKDVLNISYATEISSVKVINMIGQEVLSKNVNATSSQVDMSQLSAGTYIVNVTLGDTIKTLKVVKQ
ncbi:T9SS-dependent choice-of-anchor J family protein [Flavobacterium cyclinae]|uniref:T9SS-dependent choice-of-anchor J family protein n=1 Tax=Flavobacterium cyclinae TaxID=2895947 RepID=UPI001E453646|nr:choice-of-anchor J domain-containing protein [Flavobacterium cyclinae]UGS20197.1 choice-of-anchor J domain-containing protein [Flavobacterium cyclinae]